MSELYVLWRFYSYNHSVRGSIITSKEENTSYIKGTGFFIYFFFFFCFLFKWAHLKRAEAEEQKGLGNYPENSNYIQRSLWFRVHVCCSRLPVRSRGRRQWQLRALTPVVPGLPKCIKLNDWQWLKPHGAWGKLPGLGLTSADLPSLSAFTTPLKLFEKDICFVFFILVHGTRVTREDGTGKPFLHPVRHDSSQWFLCERLSQHDGLIKHAQNSGGGGQGQ